MLRENAVFGMVTSAYDASASELSNPLAALLDSRQRLNTPPLAIEDLRGKVVLVNFWTYFCINCLRNLASFAQIMPIFAG